MSVSSRIAELHDLSRQLLAEAKRKEEELARMRAAAQALEACASELQRGLRKR